MALEACSGARRGFDSGFDQPQRIRWSQLSAGLKVDNRDTVLTGMFRVSRPRGRPLKVL